MGLSRALLPWVACAVLAQAQVAILQIQVVEGEGAVHNPGSRSTRPLTVEVKDETGKPAAGAAVTFTLPEDGPTGTFANGLKTEVVTADARGRATLRSLQVNRNPGRFQIRITCSLEQARAGTVSFQYISGTAAPASPVASGKGPQGGGPQAKSRSKWPLVLLAVGAAAAGGIAAGARGGGSSGGGGSVLVSSPAPPTVPAAPPLTIGPPTVIVGRP